MPNIPQGTAPIFSQLADDPDLCGIVKMFVDEMPTRIDRLIRDFNSKNWDELKNTAHKLRGTAGCYGFGEVTSIAGKLEHSLKTEMSEEDIQQSLNELIEICQRMAIHKDSE